MTYLTLGDIDVSLFVSRYPFGKASSRVFDNNLGLHDAFLIDDRYIFVQVRVHTISHQLSYPSVCVLTAYSKCAE